MKRALLNLSGGIDSAFCMWQALKSGEHLLVHHIKLKNHEGRQEVEQIAVNRILWWMRYQQLPGTFKYIESGFDYGTIRYTIYDVNIWSFFTAVILRNPRNADIDRVIIPRHLDSFPNRTDLNEIYENRITLFKTLANIVGRRPDVEFVFPLESMTKREIILACPVDLLSMCWYCRRPTDKKRPCHSCITCKQVDAILQPAKRPLPTGIRCLVCDSSDVSQDAYRDDLAKCNGCGTLWKALA